VRIEADHGGTRADFRCDPAPQVARRLACLQRAGLSSDQTEIREDAGALVAFAKVVFER
jgi:hypothetical protein